MKLLTVNKLLYKKEYFVLLFIPQNNLSYPVIYN